MSVRTAASACSRDGRGATGAGAARTWSDRPCFGHGLTLVFFTSMTGLSVRPALARRQYRECHRGGRVSQSAEDHFVPTRLLDAAFPFRMAYAMSAPRTPSRAVGSTPI